jgi:uridylate kinase
MARFKRILLKLSGESLMGKQGFGIDPERLSDYARQIKEIHDMGVEIGIVIGGGNIFRGLSGSQKGFDRVKGDQMGMCATVINSLALSSALGAIGVKNKVLTAIRMEPIGEFYTKWKAIEAMQQGNVCIFSAGTGSPYFTTDTGSSLRGIEIEADVMLKGTRVDGIYTADPEKDPTATKFDDITYKEVLARGLKVTLEITLLSMLFGSMLGIGLLAMRRSQRSWLSKTAKAYSLILRGIPMVVLLMILFYIVFIGFSGIWVAVVAFTMTFASSFATTMDNAIQAVGDQQREAGEAMGFSRIQIFRYITGPQAFKRALPRFKSEAIGLIKNTSVVGYVAIQDLTRACDMIRARTFEAFFPLLFITVIYFVLAWLMGKFLDYIFKIAIKI